MVFLEMPISNKERTQAMLKLYRIAFRVGKRKAVWYNVKGKSVTPIEHSCENSRFSSLLVDFGKVLCSSAKKLSAYDRIPDRFYVMGIEFLSLSSRRSSPRNVHPAAMSETSVFAGYIEHNSKGAVWRASLVN